MSLRFLVSGGTGFLGPRVVGHLERLGEVTRLSRSLPDCVRADLCKWDGGLRPETLRDRFDVFVHIAGLYDLRAGHVESYRQNIFGTHTALTLAEKARIPHFVHISTVAVVVREDGACVSPEHLDPLRPFPDHYAASKAQAEMLVRTWRGDFASKLILRPGILVGDSVEGRIARVDGPYHALQAVRRLKSWLEKFPGPIPLPGGTRRSLPLVPVDVAAGAVARLIEISRTENWAGTKSLYVSPSRGTPAEELFREIFARNGLGQKEFLFYERIPTELVKAVAEWTAHLPHEEVEYLLTLPGLDTSETDRILGARWCPAFADYKDAFFDGYEKHLSHS